MIEIKISSKKDTIEKFKYVCECGNDSFKIEYVQNKILPSHLNVICSNEKCNKTYLLFLKGD